MADIITDEIGQFRRLSSKENISLLNLEPQMLFDCGQYKGNVYLIGCGLSEPSIEIPTTLEVSFGYNPEANNLLPRAKLEHFDNRNVFTPEKFLILRPFGLTLIGRPQDKFWFRCYYPIEATVRIDLYGFIL